MFTATCIAVLSLAQGVRAQIDNVPYIDENGKPQTADNVKLITSENIATIDNLGGWYLVRGNLTRDTLTVLAGYIVYIILEDGSELTTTINVLESNSLVIYAQSEDDGKGKLTATVRAGIGSVVFIGGGGAVTVVAVGPPASSSSESSSSSNTSSSSGTSSSSSSGGDGTSSGGGMSSSSSDPSSCVPFDLLVIKRWENTLSVIDPKKTYSTYAWYRNGKPIGDGQWWSAGSKGEQIPAGFYRVDLITKEGKLLQSCSEYINEPAETETLDKTTTNAYDAAGRFVTGKSGYKVLLRKAK